MGRTRARTGRAGNARRSEPPPPPPPQPPSRLQRAAGAATSVQALVAAVVALIVTVTGLLAALHLGSPARDPVVSTRTTGPPAGPTAAPDGRPYLAGSEPVSENDYGGVTTAILAHQYFPHSPQVGCRPADVGGGYAEWTVGGGDRPSRFAATVGIDDGAGGDSPATADLSFTDERRRPLRDTVTVTLGHPRQVTFPIPAVGLRLRVGCVARGGPSGRPPGPPPDDGPPPPRGGPPPGPHFYASLGDATLG